MQCVAEVNLVSRSQSLILTYKAFLFYKIGGMEDLR